MSMNVVLALFTALFVKTNFYSGNVKRHVNFQKTNNKNNSNISTHE